MKLLILGWCLLLIVACVRGQTSSHFRYPPGIPLNQGWRWQAGDNPVWSDPALDDRSWTPIDPGQDICDLSPLWQTRIGWFRLRFRVDSTMTQSAWSLLVEQTGASEIYLNGRLIGRFGQLDDGRGRVRGASPAIGTFIGAPFQRAGEQVLAVRFAVQPGVPYIQFVKYRNTALSLFLTKTNDGNRFRANEIRQPLDYFKFGAFSLLAVLHLALFFYGTSRRANGYFFLYALSVAIQALLLGLVYYQIESVFPFMVVLIAISLLYLLTIVFLLLGLYAIFNMQKGAIFWVLMGYAALSFVLLFAHYHGSYNLGITPLGMLALLESVRITYLSVRKRQRGAGIILRGCACFVVFNLLWVLTNSGVLPEGPALLYEHLAYNLGYLSLPISISIYLALESALASRGLAEQFREVQRLSGEKAQLLATQNERLEQEVSDRTAELNRSLIQLKTTQNQLIQHEKLASLGELTAGIAHEIQNPLNLVNNFAEVSVELAEDLEASLQANDTASVQALSEDLRQNMAYIHQNGQRASFIIQAMLEHARTSPGERQPVELNRLVEEYLKLAYHGFRAKDNGFTAELRFDLATDLPVVEGIPQELGRVLLNLYNNAFYALRQRSQQGEAGYAPTVWVTTRRASDRVEVRVGDNGVGMPPEVQEKIFQPFYTTKPTGEGTGMGLSLSYEIITQGHNGALEVNSREGEGTEFTIRL